MKKIIIGILPQDRIRQRMLAIASGKYKPARGEPRVWFTSMKSVAEVLSDRNRALIRAIAEQQPDSLQQLAEMTGRKPGNLSRTLKTLSSYGFVELRRENGRLRPIANATQFEIRAA